MAYEHPASALDGFAVGAVGDICPRGGLRCALYSFVVDESGALNAAYLVRCARSAFASLNSPCARTRYSSAVCW